MIPTEQRDYYCSIKFRFLKIDLESNTTYNCHAASPHIINFDWLKTHPGQIFNTDINVRERKMMLANIRNSSCEQNCWVAEDRGAISPRIIQGGIDRTHGAVDTQPDILDITVGAHCNLTCSYCCKEYSTAWRRDIEVMPYTVSDSERFTLTPRDKLLTKISQAELVSSSKYQTLLEEIARLTPSLRKVVITGGEPLLFNPIIDLLKNSEFRLDVEIQLYTGLGLDYKRFDRLTDRLLGVPGLCYTISAENIGSMLEFNRYGIKWKEFESKIQLLKDKMIPFNFQATLSNLTIPGFRDFYDRFSEHDITINFAYQPRMMAPYVLDDHSKDAVRKTLDALPGNMQTQIEKSINHVPSEQDRRDIGIFLKRFIATRSNLDLNIFPKTFQDWIQHVV